MEKVTSEITRKDAIRRGEREIGGPKQQHQKQIRLAKAQQKEQEARTTNGPDNWIDVVPSLSIGVAFVLEQDGSGIGRAFQGHVPKPDISVWHSLRRSSLTPRHLGRTCR